MPDTGPVNDTYIRETALHMALALYDGSGDAEDVVYAATLFARFIKGEDFDQQLPIKIEFDRAAPVGDEVWPASEPPTPPHDEFPKG
jgi:hypothetical protein